MAKKKLFMATRAVRAERLFPAIASNDTEQFAAVMGDALNDAMNDVRAQMDRLGASSDPKFVPQITITFESSGVLS